jgi:hypothetical protein
MLTFNSVKSFKNLNFVILTETNLQFFVQFVSVSGLHELEAIVGYASTMGVKCEILIAPSLVRFSLLLFYFFDIS